MRKYINFSNTKKNIFKYLSIIIFNLFFLLFIMINKTFILIKKNKNIRTKKKYIHYSSFFSSSDFNTSPIFFDLKKLILVPE